mgnify:CR=1 FL=1
MWFWWFMLICDLLIPITMLIGGRMMWKHCPKRINGMAGYRTTRSMKNMDTWRFAHDYCGKLWWKIGWVIIIPSALIHIPLYHSDKNTIGFAGIILVTIQCFIWTGGRGSSISAGYAHCRSSCRPCAWQTQPRRPDYRQKAFSRLSYCVD